MDFSRCFSEQPKLAEKVDVNLSCLSRAASLTSYLYIYVYDVWLYDGICMYVGLQMKQSQQGQLDKWFSVVRIRRGWSFIKPTITTICPTWLYHVFCVKEQGGFRHRYVFLAKKNLAILLKYIDKNSFSSASCD